MALSLPQAPCKGCGTGSQSHCPPHELVGAGGALWCLSVPGTLVLWLWAVVLSLVLVPVVAVLVCGSARARGTINILAALSCCTGRGCC